MRRGERAEEDLEREDDRALLRTTSPQSAHGSYEAGNLPIEQFLQPPGPASSLHASHRSDRDTLLPIQHLSCFLTRATHHFLS